MVRAESAATLSYRSAKDGSQAELKCNVPANRSFTFGRALPAIVAARQGKASWPWQTEIAPSCACSSLRSSAMMRNVAFTLAAENNYRYLLLTLRPDSGRGTLRERAVRTGSSSSSSSSSSSPSSSAQDIGLTIPFVNSISFLGSPAILSHGMKPPCDSSVHPTASRNAIEIEDIEARVAALAVRFVAESAAKGDEEQPVALRPERFVATGARSQGLAFRDRSAIHTQCSHKEGAP